MATSLLDLVGVVLMGLVGALAVTVIQSQPPPAFVSDLADRLGLQDATSQQLVLAFGLMAAVVLLAKSAISSFLLRRVLKFLANRQALVSARLTAELMSRPLTEIQQRSSQETAYALMGGAGAATVGLLGQLVVIATEVALLVVLATALMFLDPIVTLGAVAFFSLVAVAIQKALGNWAGRVGSAGAEMDIASLNAVQEALAAYREIAVSNRRSLYVHRVQGLRWSAATLSADSSFIGQVPKYVFEAALVTGGFLLAGLLFVTKDAVVAVGTLSLFVAAASRVMPSLLRLQGAILGIRSAAGAAQPTFDLAEALSHPIDRPPSPLVISELRRQLTSDHKGFVSCVEVNGVSVRYPGSIHLALDGVSLNVNEGQSVALVGASGAGKSTLADVILGIIEPDVGEVILSGTSPNLAISEWPGAIAYVPQEVVLANGTVRENVALGIPQDAVDDSMVWGALEQVALATFLREQRDGIDTLIGEGGLRLSGGQRQRLGLARALFTRPRLLLLDEATSALDAETERAVTETIESLSGRVTRIIVAHRLSTVRNADQVYYLEGGCLVASGSFEEVRLSVPAFARQAHLMGL